VRGQSCLRADSLHLLRIRRHTTERTGKKGGNVIQTIRRVVSRNGKTMTATVTGTNAQGQAAKNVAVFEKQ
jgi:hypothetical protein